MTLYRQHGMKRVTEEDIVSRAEGRKWRNSPFTSLYHHRQRMLTVWGLMFLLAALLITVFYPWGIILFGRFGK